MTILSATQRRMMEPYQKRHTAKEGHLVDYSVSKNGSDWDRSSPLTEVDAEEGPEYTARRKASVREFDFHRSVVIVFGLDLMDGVGLSD
jgi:hypothetical protein